MSPRPDTYYPTEPRYEDFLVKFNHLNHIHATGFTPNPAGSGSTPAAGSVYVKWDGAAMDAEIYQKYINAFNMWRLTCVALDNENHIKAKERQALEHYKEQTELVVHMSGADVPLDGWTKTADLIGPALHPGAGKKAQLKTTYKKKTAVAPQVSKKPEKIAKSAASKALNKKRTEIAAEKLALRGDVLTSTLPLFKEVTKERAALSIRMPLHKAEENAAKSAKTRSQAITFGSTDVVSNISPDGWKVVTRKRGSEQLSLGQTKIVEADDGKTKVVSSLGDLSVRASVPHMAAVRLPTSTKG